MLSDSKVFRYTLAPEQCTASDKAIHSAHLYRFYKNHLRGIQDHWVKEIPFNSLVNRHHLQLKCATMIRQANGNIQVKLHKVHIATKLITEYKAILES